MGQKYRLMNTSLLTELIPAELIEYFTIIKCESLFIVAQKHEYL